MTVTRTSDWLIDLLCPDRLTAVVDVGANPIGGDPPYKPLLAAGLCSVVGFEPQADALAALNARKSTFETYLPYVVGDGTPATLHVCYGGTMTSLLRPDRKFAKYLKPFEEWCKVVNELPVETRRLDDIVEVANVDFLKIDVQGAELAVFKNGISKLKDAVAIQTEISFLPLYEKQPPFGEIDLELRRLGFVPHCFADIKKWMIFPFAVQEDDPDATFNQLLEADIVYVRDFARGEQMQPEQLKHLAIIAHHCYGSFDLALNCISQLVARGAASEDAVSRYVAKLPNR
jgi:FkbM family methyltransferase